MEGGRVPLEGLLVRRQGTGRREEDGASWICREGRAQLVPGGTADCRDSAETRTFSAGLLVPCRAVAVLTASKLALTAEHHQSESEESRESAPN